MKVEQLDHLVLPVSDIESIAHADTDIIAKKAKIPLKQAKSVSLAAKQFRAEKASK